MGHCVTGSHRATLGSTANGSDPRPPVVASPGGTREDAGHTPTHEDYETPQPDLSIANELPTERVTGQAWTRSPMAQPWEQDGQED